MDELVAQLTAAYVLADLGIANEPRPDDAAYIASWLTALRDDPRAIFTAASQAQAAADWMHARQTAAPEQGTPFRASSHDGDAPSPALQLDDGGPTLS